MFVVTVRFMGPADTAAAFLTALRENATRSLENEDGCLRFDVCTDPDAPGEIFLYEVYADAAAFEAHKQTPHYAAFSETAGGWVREKSVRTWSLHA